MLQAFLAAIIAGSLSFMVLSSLIFIFDKVHPTNRPRSIHWGIVVISVLVAVMAYFNYLGR